MASLFTTDAVYFYGPFREPARGRDEIVRRWIAGGPSPDMTSSHELVALDGARAVIHWTVTAGGRAMDGLLVLTFDEAGLCRQHREWYAEAPAGATITPIPS